MEDRKKSFSVGRLAFGLFLFLSFLIGSPDCSIAAIRSTNVSYSVLGLQPPVTRHAMGFSHEQNGPLPITQLDGCAGTPPRTYSISKSQTFSMRSILSIPTPRIIGVEMGRAKKRSRAHRPLTAVLTVRCTGADDTMALAAAVTAARGKAIVIANGQTCATGNITIPNLRIEKGGLLKPIKLQTVTLSGNFDAGLYQTFTNALAGGGEISFVDNPSVDSVYPQWWGAMGRSAADQTKDDTTAIQAALNSGAGKIVIPAGHYMIDGVIAIGTNHFGGLHLASNTEVIMGQQTFLHVKNNDSVSYSVLVGYKVSNVTIRGGNLVGDNITNRRAPYPNPSGYGLHLEGSNSVWVYGVTSQDMLADGFFIAYDAYDGAGLFPESENVHLINCTGYRNYRQGASVVGAKHGSIEGGKYYGTAGSSPQDGIDIEPNLNIHGGSPSIVSDFLIKGVTATGNAGSGIELIGQGSAVGVDILDNHSYANRQAGIVYRASSKGKITGNTTDTNAGSGISVYHSRYVDVSNNNSHGNGQSGIIVQNPSEPAGAATQHINVINNILNGNYAGIEINGLTNTINDVLVSKNISTGNLRDGIYLYKVVNGTVDGNQVSANSQLDDNVSDGIAVYNSANCSISNNTVRRGGGAKQPRYGINLSSSTDTIVRNNDLVTAGKTDAIKDAATRSDVSGNKLENVPIRDPRQKPRH